MRRAFVVVVAALAYACAAAAADVDRAQVGVPGRNETRGFAASLYVDVKILPGYSRVTFDGDHGVWKGPAYTGGDHASIDWTVYFDHLSLAAAAKRNLIQSWPVIETKQLTVAHVIGGRTVGTLRGVAIVTREPGSNAAQVEATFAFPLCGGLVATIEAAALSPPAATDGMGNQITVGGVPAPTWNHDKVLGVVDGVSVDGHLPLGKLEAKAAGRRITGRVVDCARQPEPGILVTAKGRRAKTTAAGTFSLRVPGPGTYAVSAQSPGGGSAHATVRVR